MYQRSTAVGDNWWFRSSAEFSRSYGKANPYEDWATTFAAYFTDLAGYEFQDDDQRDSFYAPDDLPEKLRYVEYLVDTASRVSTEFLPGVNVGSASAATRSNALVPVASGLVETVTPPISVSGQPGPSHSFSLFASMGHNSWIDAEDIDLFAV